MGDLYANKYRIQSARLQTWDYANAAMYYVTICTKNREHYFGEIIDMPEQQDPVLRPTEIGRIAFEEWYKTPELRPDMNLSLGEFIVMPNHIHGIIRIGSNEYNTSTYDVNDEIIMNGENNGDRKITKNAMNNGQNGENDVHGENNGDGKITKNAMNNGQNGRDAMHGVSTILPIISNSSNSPNFSNSPYNFNSPKNQFGPQSKNLGSIIRGYKSAVTTYARKHNIEFNWQPRYYDHIIRSIDEYHRISNYIQNNPSKWRTNRFYDQ